MYVLATKLHRPALPARLVQRTLLSENLTAGMQSGCALTLASAPAGFGKSTCVSAWLDRLRLPYAWLSLDASDDDPLRFFAYLVAALQQVDPSLGESLAAVLRIDQLPPITALTTTLLNDISRLDRPFLLILDDFHLIHDRAILSAFEVFLANQPPNLHLVLITREDPSLPLARLRASGRLQEVRAETLRFNQYEAMGLLSGLGLNLSDSDVATLVARTEGWVVGLQLAGISMRSRPNPSDLITRLGGSHRFILSYLTEEVLDRLSEDRQRFLLETSILDRMSGSLCDAVTGRTDSAEILEDLLKANLFLIPLDDEQGWYRYHHLFAELLSGRLKLLSEPKIAGLYQRASRWFARVCDKSSSVDRPALASEAVRYALAAEDYPAAVQLIETHIGAMLNQWYARVASAWMEALPIEWRVRSPRANLAFARMFLLKGDLAQMAAYIARLQPIFSGPEKEQVEPSLRREFLAIQSTLMSARGDPEAALKLANEALAIPGEADPQASGQVYMALAAAYQYLGNLPGASESYQKLIEIGQRTGDIITELMGISALALLWIQHGQLQDGFRLAGLGVSQAERLGGDPPICAGIYGELGQIHFYWGEFDQAMGYLQRAAQVGTSDSFSDAAIFYCVSSSRLAMIRGDLAQAVQEIHRAVELSHGDAPVVVREEVVAQQVRVYLAQHDLAEAEQVLQQVTGVALDKTGLAQVKTGQHVPYSDCLLHLSVLRFRLYAVQEKPIILSDDLSGVLDSTNHLLSVVLERRYVLLAIETYLLRSQLYELSHQAEASLADLDAALDLAEPEGYLSVFGFEGWPVKHALRAAQTRCRSDSRRAGFIGKVLGVFPVEPEDGAQPLTGGRGAAGSAALPEALTARELEVLRCMAEGMTYEETATHLVVSINTIRTHVKAIYGKLGVNNRISAIEVARKLALL